MSLPTHYQDILSRFLDQGAEEDLLQAYDIGKAFQANHVSPDQVIGVHLEAIERLSLDAPEKEQVQVVLSSFSVLIETMIAYGIAYLEGAERERREILQKEQIIQLQQLDRMKNQFLGILSHELRTPINSIMGFGSVIEDEVLGPVPDAYKPYVGKILSSSEQLLALVNDLLDMSSVQAGKFGLSVASIRMSDVVSEVVSNLEGLAGLKDLRIINEVPDTLPDIIADRQRTGQIMTNLVSNAIKFTPSGGTIALRARVERRTLMIEVEDTGIGISKVDQKKIFASFVQVDMSDTRGYGGTGLGLSISKALVEAHGGAIGVRSAPADGSTFWFTLPLPALETQELTSTV